MTRGLAALSPLTVREALEARPIPELQGLVKLAALGRIQRKAELVAAIERYLGSDENLRAEMARMGDLERLALAEAAHAPDGQVHWGRFRAKHGSLPARDESGRLSLFLLAGNRLPADLRERVQRMLPEPAAAVMHGVADLPPAPDAGDALTVRQTARAARTDLVSVLQLIDAGKLRCSDKTRRPTAATMALLAEALSEGDFYDDPTGWIGPIAAFAWPLLTQAGGFAELAGTRLRLTSRGRAALAAPAQEGLRHLWERWVKHGLIDEFSRVEAIKGQGSKSGRALTAVGPRRAVVAEALAACPPGKWVDIDELFRFMRAEDLDPEVARDLWSLYIVDPEYGSLGYEGYGDWPVVQGRYVLALLLEYAAPLGLIDVAYGDPEGARDDYGGMWGADDLPFLSRYDGLRYIRLNALGAYILGVAAAYAPEPGVDDAETEAPALRVLPNLEVVVVGRRLAAGDTAFLEVWSERTGDVTWRLTAKRILAAVETGRDVADLSEFLRARARAELPETVATLLADLTERAGKLRDAGPARLIECADAGLAQLLVGDRRLREICRPCGERHVAVLAAGEAAFRKRLRELGYVLPPAGER